MRRHALLLLLLAVPVGGALTGLHTEVQLIELLPNGTIPLPENTTEVAIEIGANSRDTMDQTWLPFRPNAFLITFEPILDKYATLLARGSAGSDAKTKLGAHHKRGIVLPIAVSSSEGHALVCGAEFEPAFPGLVSHVPNPIARLIHTVDSCIWTVRSMDALHSSRRITHASIPNARLLVRRSRK